MTPENRHTYCADVMARASESLDDAQKSLAMDMFKAAVSQSYYAMFHAASALLAARDIQRHTHGGVKAALGQHFCKTGDIEPRFNSMVGKAFDMRIDCDYKVRHKQARSGAEMAVEWAREFLAAAEERLKVELAELKGDAPGEATSGEGS